MFRLKHSDKAAEPKNGEEKASKKGSITWFVPGFVKRASSIFDEKRKDEESSKTLQKEGSATFEISNPASLAPGSPAMAKQPSAKGIQTPPDTVSDGSVTPNSVNTGATTPVKMSSFSGPKNGSSRKIPSLSLDNTGLPPALQNREENVPTRAPAMSIGSSIIDRYWRLSDVLEDRNVALSWRARVLMALDTARDLKKLHQAGVAHGLLTPDTVLVNQESKCKIQNSETLTKTSDAASLQRDVLFFGTILIQLSLHQSLDLGGSQANRTDGINSLPAENYENLRKIFSRTLANEDVTDLEDSWEFGESLSTEIRSLVGFRPLQSESVSEDAIKSLEELAVQCCAAMASNRPESDAVEDWLAAIVDMVGGVTITADDRDAQEKMLWALQSNERELLGDVTLAEENELVTGKSAVKVEPIQEQDDDEKQEDGYETDDSFMPPPLQTRRPSRLSMFIEANDQPTVTTTTTTLKSGDDENEKKKLKKRGNSRMSIKPTALNVERFAGMHRRASSSAGLVLTPVQCRAKFDKQERLTREEIMVLLSKAEDVLRAEPNLPVVQAPVTVVGDIHGQYFDLVNMIDQAGPAGATKYLFLGDYVDRGSWSCEVLFYILSMKVAYPQSVTMIRGNHECDAVASYFGFKEEVEIKYGRAIFNRCIALFQCMPVGAVLDTGGAGRFLCVHGGISPHVTSLEQFETINRFQEPGMNGFLCDVLWSDPIKDDFDDGQHGKSLGDFLSIDFVSNPARGCSFRYGYSAIVKFLATNRLVAIIRAHEVMQEGFRYHFQTITGGGKGQARIMPPVITVFSAPNYLGTYGNLGAYLRVSSAKDRAAQGGGFKPIDLLEPKQFSAVIPPAPLILESETQMQKMTIETACPYMPTTFDSFISAALEFALGEDEDENELLAGIPETEEDNAKSVFELEGVAFAPGMEQRRKESIEREAKELKEVLTNTIKVEMQGADLSGLLPTTSAGRRQSIVELQKKKGVSSLIAQFSKAAAADGINEMHPSLVQQKMSEAKKKIDTESNTSKGKKGDDQPILGGGGGGGRRTVVANKKQPALKDDGGRKSVANAKKTSSRNSEAAAKKSASALAPPIPGTPTKSDGPVEVEVDFSENEIVALQMLYLMIDRENQGLVRSKDLTLWSAADGATISENDANLCIEALDLDEDGAVGFSDYLAFAARLKMKFEKLRARTASGSPN